MNSDKPTARYDIVRNSQIMRRGHKAQANSRFRGFVITSNSFSSAKAKFQVYGIESDDDQITVLCDNDFDSFDLATKQFDQRIREARQDGFRTATIADLIQ